MLHRRRKVTLAFRIFVLTTALVLPRPGRRQPSTSDQVLAWNLNAYNELIVTCQAPPVAVIHLAMVHGADLRRCERDRRRLPASVLVGSATRRHGVDAAAAAAA